MTSKLYRSRKDNVISGVCGGFGKHFNIDPVIVRIFWALITIYETNIGIIGYIACAIIIPLTPKVCNETDYNNDGFEKKCVNLKKSDTTSNSVNHNKNTVLIGLILIILGGLFILKRFYSWIDIDNLWPALLILAGVFIIVKKD